MSGALVFERNRATVEEIAWHLQQCARAFAPPLDARVDIGTYAEKLFRHAACFEARNHGVLAGLVAGYLNDPHRSVAFISSVSVLAECQGQGIAYTLVGQCVTQARQLGFRRVELEVGHSNAPALGLYSKIGFLPEKGTGDTIHLHLPL